MMFSVISIMTAISIFFGGFAIAPVSWHEISSGVFTFKVETKLNEPISKELAEEMGGILLDNLSAELDVRFKTSEDFKKQEIQYDMVLSNQIDEPIKTSYWIRSDFSDKNIPKIFLAYQMQEDETYYVMDIQHPMVYGRGNTIGMIFQMMSGEMLMSVSNNISEGLKDREFDLIEKDGEVSAVMDEATLKEVIRQIAIGGAEPLSLIFGTSGPQITAQIDDFFAKLEEVAIFGEDALVLHMTKDEKGQPKNIRYEIHVQTNVYELVKAFDGYVDERLTKENSDIDMMVGFEYTYDKVNEDIAIDYPVLTEENSVDISRGQSLAEIDVNAVNIVVEQELVQLQHKSFEKDGTTYLPLREILNLKGVSNENILWDNGIIKVQTPDYSARFAIGSNEINRDGQTINIQEEVVLQGDTTFIPFTAFGDLGLGSMTNLFYDDNDAITGSVISLYRYRGWDTDIMRFLVSGIPAEWEKLLYQAGDRMGVETEINYMVEEQYLEQTNLVIAAGDPMVLIGKYSDEFLERLLEVDVIYPPLKVDEEYRILVQKVMKNPDAALEMAKQFIEMVREYDGK